MYVLVYKRLRYNTMVVTKIVCQYRVGTSGSRTIENGTKKVNGKLIGTSKAMKRVSFLALFAFDFGLLHK